MAKSKPKHVSKFTPKKIIEVEVDMSTIVSMLKGHDNTIIRGEKQYPIRLICDETHDNLIDALNAFETEWERG